MGLQYSSQLMKHRYLSPLSMKVIRKSNGMEKCNIFATEKGCFVFQQNLTRVVACTERCSDKNVGALAKKLGLL